jgi:hypothetical protein
LTIYKFFGGAKADVPDMVKPPLAISPNVKFVN